MGKNSVVRSRSQTPEEKYQDKKKIGRRRANSGDANPSPCSQEYQIINQPPKCVMRVARVLRTAQRILPLPVAHAQFRNTVGSREKLLTDCSTLVHGARSLLLRDSLSASSGLHVACGGLKLTDGFAHAATAPLVVLHQLLIPISKLQPEASCGFCRFSDDQCPCPSDLVVRLVLVSLVLVRIPIRESMNHVCDGIEVCEREPSLSFLRWKIVRCVVAEGLNELKQILTDPVIGVVGGVTVAQRESVAQVLFVFCEDCESGIDRRSGCLCHDGLADVGALIADVLNQVAELVGREGLKKSRKRQRAACRSVCASALDVALCAV